MADTVRHMDEYAGNIDRWFQANAGKLTWLAIVLVLVLVTDRLVSRVLRKVLDNSQIPSASIFVNLARVTIWVTGAAMVLQPVFGINPTTLITALGVGGVAISLGLKDTIANIIGGVNPRKAGTSVMFPAAKNGSCAIPPGIWRVRA